ncbi:filament-like plant protein 3 [Salvia miltiorrhiza]|uniref:filament-like plant protein 3 n=1 Tax=Salvia miltiorrhiza TaxID=226208 RepID=UPI0025ACDB9E|nr:filament-like plant protein 3 [Salvia miltiorrhiza]XP_057791570.1 filament-like plant protein 3 [Salvia miltiorrhiza]XP_057791571.1 filament-like plant protein 3 [Salvia miltiorrhiza]XP_057791572.1 filament-like plant protein 3 [Salvia miltiorrhiza]XP_057791573.1 filament-like plant protein 3 [Salvia miltiorrhiza]XP_057791574.1 filament-like plant protein 3 [Salvia miltiorrhiza]XP_057791575.1 filament-like plant protein 3 [Salvia miltiorrhiza]
MDRRSWLWRRKSSEKSPSGETESSGSVSSHSERFSDDQTLSNHNIQSPETLSNHNIQSPEVTSKAAPDDELNDNVKTLSEKLSEALINIGAKEDLVKQHAKVAEEAVSGWEKAESEVLVLKKQNDSLTQKNSILEERVGHLDGALKECLRQLRQAREDQEEKLYGAIANRSSEWESKKSELENQLSELHNQLRNAKSEANVLADVRSKLEAAEKENSILKLKLLSKEEELEQRISESDLSTYVAETASKQHLDSIKKVAKLEAECRRLKALVRKATMTNDHQSVTTSSVYVESFTDSQSDNGERVLFMENDSFRISGLESIDNEPCYPDSRASALRKDLEQSKHERAPGRSLIVPSVEIDLMDDFLEMERLAAQSETHNGSGPGSRIDGEESILRNELDAMTKRATGLEDSLKKITAEKVNLEIALYENQIKLMASENQLKQTEVTLVDLRKQLVLADEAKRDAHKQVECSNVKLENSTKLLDEAEGKLIMVQDKLSEAERKLIKFQDKLSEVNELKNELELQLEDANLKKVESESKLKVMELELKTLRSSISTLQKEVEKEKIHSREAIAKCDKLEAELSGTKSNSQLQRSAIIEEFRVNQDKELAAAAGRFAECQKTIASLGRQLKTLATFEDFLIDSETPIAVL